MRVLAISDIHGWLPKLRGEYDVLLVAGDIVPDEWNPEYTDDPPSIAEQASWIRGSFSDWCESAPAKHVVVIAGNHDIPLMRNPGLMDDVACIYLQDESIEIDGKIIHGSPWTPTFGSWAFMKKDAELAEEWDKIPQDVDILMTHGPAWGKCDEATAFAYDPKQKLMLPNGFDHVGSSSLAYKLEYGMYPNLALHVFGHIHPAYGIITEGSRTYANVSYVNSGYQPANKPRFFEV